MCFINENFHRKNYFKAKPINSSKIDSRGKISKSIDLSKTIDESDADQQQIDTNKIDDLIVVDKPQNFEIGKIVEDVDISNASESSKKIDNTKKYCKVNKVKPIGLESIKEDIQHNGSSNSGIFLFCKYEDFETENNKYSGIVKKSDQGDIGTIKKPKNRQKVYNVNANEPIPGEFVENQQNENNCGSQLIGQKGSELDKNVFHFFSF